MTDATQSTTQKTPPVRQMTADASGSITGLEANVTYFVVRKPTPEYTREQTRRMVEDVRHFLHEQRVLAERQMKEFNDKYGETARGRVQEIRGTLEKRFDEIAKELETRIEKIESDLTDRGILKRKDGEANAHPHAAGETPGEMPTGHQEPTTSTSTGATSAATDAAKAAGSTTTPKKKPAGGKKDE